MKKFVPILALAVLLSGCAVKNAIVGPPVPVAVQSISLGASALKTVTDGLKTAQDTLATIHQAGFVSDAEAANINSVIVAINQKDEAAQAAVQAALASCGATASNCGNGWVPLVQAVGTAIASINPSSLNIVSASGQQQYSALVKALQADAAILIQDFPGGTS